MTFYYSIRNGGDGSASIEWVESAELGSWLQDHMDEDWGEDCSGEINLSSESPITFNGSITTKEETLVSLLLNEAKDVDDFIDQFFPNGLPTFRVEKLDEIIKKKYCYNNIFIEDKLIEKKFTRLEDAGEILENRINDYSRNSH